MSQQRVGKAIVIEGETYAFVSLEEHQQLIDKAEAFDDVKKTFNEMEKVIDSDLDDFEKGYRLGAGLGELHEIVNRIDSEEG